MTSQPTHGGARVGVQGKGYAQRTDLNANPARTTARTPPAAAGPPVPSGYIPPDAIPPLDAPTADGRPITDGLPLGPGAGPTALVPGPTTGTDSTRATLLYLYQQTGSEDIRRLLARHDEGV